MGASGSVPEWLSEVMEEEEVYVLKDAMHDHGLEEEDFRDFTDEALEQAGGKSAITRAKMLRTIREHFKKRKREEEEERERQRRRRTRTIRKRGGRGRGR